MNEHLPEFGYRRTPGVDPVVPKGAPKIERFARLHTVQGPRMRKLHSAGRAFLPCNCSVFAGSDDKGSPAVVMVPCSAHYYDSTRESFYRLYGAELALKNNTDNALQVCARLLAEAAAE